MNGRIRYVQYPTFGRELEIAQEALSPTAFSVTQTCRRRRHQTARNYLSHFSRRVARLAAALKSKTVLYPRKPLFL
jgi:hypothetical protein